ncbi:MAG: hypothetical protein II333_08455, partial [Clostridia bacterium]|nr:hypothetical protein [Clostridia bacterium]
ETEPTELLTYVVDAQSIAYASEVVNAVLSGPVIPSSPVPSIPTVFVPKTFKYSLNSINLWFMKTDTLYVIGSPDVGTVTVNGQLASPLTYLTDIFGALRTAAEKLGMDYASLMGDQYRVWMYTNTVPTSENAVYEIVAHDMNGMAAAPVYAPDEAGNTSNITKDDMTGYYEQKRAEMWSIMESLANRFFNPERFDVEINETPQGKKTAAIATSEDVEYVVANGEIIDRYITETVVDLSKDGEKTVSRIWVKEVAEEEEVEVTAHDRQGTRSESKVKKNNGRGNAWGNSNKTENSWNNGNANSDNGNKGNNNSNNSWNNGNSNKNNGNDKNNGNNKNNGKNKNSRW